MKQFTRLIIFYILVLLCDTVFGQSYKMINKSEEIQIILNKNSIEVFIENKSEKTIYLPKENAVFQNCSDKKGLITIEFGIELQAFNERGRFQLNRTKSKEIL